MTDMILQTENLKKSFGKLEVLKGISTGIRRGEVVSIIGPSGGGKSTFLRCLNLLEHPTGGQIIFDGVDITDPSVNINIHRQRMGMVFQHFNLFPNMTILRNMTLAPMKLLHKSRAEAEKKAMQLLERVGLSPALAGRLPHELSGGQVQRACIARALAARPSFLVLDEAVSSLDVPVQVQVLELLRGIRSDMTCLFITHDLQAAALVCDSLLVLDQGRCVEHLPVSQLGNARSPRLRRMLETVVPFRSAWDGSWDDAAGAEDTGDTTKS